MPLPLCGETKEQADLERFLRRWPIEQLRTLTLADYATFGSKDCFIYWLEQIAPGGIGGGSAFKFGVFARDPSQDKTSDDIYSYDDHYGWYTKLGTTAGEAFLKAKASLLKIVEGVPQGDVSAVADSPFFGTVAWKLAFCYQDPARPIAVACFSEKSLRDYCKTNGINTLGVGAPELHRALIEQNAGRKTLREVGMDVWRNVGGSERNFWNYTYDFEGATDDGINDLPTLLAAGEIRCDWDAGESLAGLSPEEDEGKRQAAALLMAAGDESKATGTQAAEDELKKRPALNFFKMGLAVGAELTLVADPTKKAVVTGERTVRCEGQETSLSDATRMLLNLPYYVAPTPRWSHQGRKLNELYDEAHPRKVPTQTALMCWLFAKHMRPGDLVFARKAKTQDYVAGLVVSDYRYEPTRERFQHVRSVRWLTRTPVAVPEVGQLITKALTDITKFPHETTILVNALNIDMSKLPDPTTPEPPAPKPGQPTNVIFYGPPGTGKTYKTKEHAIRICIGADRYAETQAEGDFKRLLANGQVEFTTFHQSYDYADFVVGFKPETVGETMVFKPKPGLLLRIAKRARENPGQQYLLIMDEVNRGNISKIFGELITLIEKDKRAGGDFPLSVTLPCACPGYLEGENQDQFSLPSNVHFLGTMNTADRSIALLDTALRRRFRFKEMAPDPTLLPTSLSGINLQSLLEKLNKALREKLTRDHQIGHAWLPMNTAQYDNLNPAPNAEAIAQEINEKIMPLIDEWFYENLDDKKAALQGLAEPSKQDKAKYVVTAATLKNYAGA
jgi:hypothetical protein